jgi:cyclopropane fatty-acyl-phospholipid synthase-like methyltransferase
LTEPILDPEYWRLRLVRSEEPHHTVFKCSSDKWKMICDKHKEILENTIRPKDSILDAGCGWGRLIELLPHWWIGDYLGIDISPDLIEKARVDYPRREFIVGNLTDSIQLVDGEFDWVIMISMRPMIIRNLGQAYWDLINTKLKCFSDRILFLEYDEEDEGSIECSLSSG